MYPSTASVILSLSALAFSAPTPGDSGYPGSTTTTTDYTATFDDLSSLTENVALQAVGPYDGLDYEGIDLITLGLDGTIVAGVTPDSYPNAGAYGATTALTNGSPYITTQYSGSVTDTFDFHSFYFGCVAGTVEAVASAPESCTITVKGYKASNEVATQSFDFVPSDPVLAPMIKAELCDEFKGIDTATFSTEYELTEATGATLLDSLMYTTYNAEEQKDGKSE